MAEDDAKEAAGSQWDLADRLRFREASLAHLTRKTTKTRSQTTRDWIAGHDLPRVVDPPRPQEGVKGARWAILLALYRTRRNGADLADKIKNIESTSVGGAIAGKGTRAMAFSFDAGPGSCRER